MSIFGSIMSKIFHREPGKGPGGQATATKASTQPTPQSAPAASPASGQAGTVAQSTPPAAPASEPVDVEAVLSDMADQKGGGGNWRTSIVDLLKLLDLESSLSARKELGQELGVHAGADGSAEQNIALQKAVMRQLAENGGKVPASLRN